MSNGAVDTIYIEFSSNADSVTSGIDKLNNTLNRIKTITSGGSTGVNRINTRLSSLKGTTTRFYNKLKKVIDVSASWFNKSNEYVEALNLFNVAMGDGAEAAMAYAEKVQDLMGIDIKDWMEYQGGFHQLVEGYGIASDSAAMMSKNLTQLAYDLSSLWNKDVDTAFQKLQSGMSGQIKGLKVWGINLSVAQLRETALAHGITLSTAKMTEAQKATLRYITVMEKTQNVQGDLARTIATPANALRILNAQWEIMKRELGNIVSVLATRVIPYAQALVRVLKEAATTLATLFGYELPDIEYPTTSDSGFTDLTEDADNATDSIKRLKSIAMGFDELNILNPDENNTSLLNNYDPTFGIDLSQYDYESKFLDNIDTSKVDEIVEKFKKIGEYLGVILLGLGALKLTGFIADLITSNTYVATLKDGLALLGKKTGITLGVTLAVAGIALETKGIVDAIKNELGSVNFAEILGGGAAITVGGTMIGATFGNALLGGAIGAVVAGVPALITGIYDAISNGLNGLNASLIAISGGLIGAAIGAIIGGPVGAGIGALIGVAAGGLIDLGILVAQNWDSIVDTCATFFTSTLPQAVQNFPETISNMFSNVAEFIGSINWSGIGQKVGQSLGNAINSVIEFVANAPQKIASAMSNIASTIGNFFTQTIPNFVGSIGDMFSGLFDSISSVATWISEVKSSITGGFNEVFQSVGSSVNEFFGGLWQGLSDTVDFSPITSKIASAFNSIRQTVSSIWGSITDFLSSGLESIQSAFGSVFGSVENTVTNIFENIKNAVTSVIETIKNIINSIADTISSVFSVFSSNDTSVSVSYGVPAYATGGFPDEGEMFVAREAGPELVGTIGSKTAVANNNQIVDAVSTGVAKAVSSVMGSTQQPQQLGGSLKIKGSDLVYVVDKANRKKGATISNNFNYGGR